MEEERAVTPPIGSSIVQPASGGYSNSERTTHPQCTCMYDFASENYITITWVSKLQIRVSNSIKLEFLTPGEWIKIDMQCLKKTSYKHKI